ncbi:tetratricopeptide repeat protein [Ilyomonas limi]|uniref:Tetratricopeptide repeat protein n=1 Tax=Ilyomonas limi TaxID=2575867 RepID=A0A4U3L8C0_9BACT|nr:tetratricopeptide repeat protein [Ilyomonas limi]TKK71531.1 tetratricopeptide repeat protein [Ilyomonas limi]
MKKSLLLCFILVSLFARAEKVYDFNVTCQQAYHDITSLKLTSGQQLVTQAKQQNKDNLVPDLLQGYIDFFVLFFNEDPDEYQARRPQMENRISRFEEGTESSPYYNYCLAVGYLQKAMVAVKFNERFTAFMAFRKAFSYIKDNRKAFPGFLPNTMIYAPMQVVVGVIPDGYKGIAGLFGLKGSVKEGMKQMQGFVNSNDPTAKFFFNEAAFYYCYLLFYIQNEPQQAFQFIKQNKLDVVNNHLFAYMTANLALNNKQTDYAESIIRNRSSATGYLETPVWDYEMAFVKIHQLQLPEAIYYFERFLHHFKGNFYVKDAYQKLSWCYYLHGDMAAAENARKLLLKRGNTLSDADKQANREAKSGEYPNVTLLKARLLNDGGYNTAALNILAGKTIKDFAKPEEKLEFNYRLARIYDELGRDSDAIQAYNATIKMGENSKEYYAARAAWQTGILYEQAGRREMAISYYQKCLSMKDHDYKDAIDQKAKAGIARCKGQ